MRDGRLYARGASDDKGNFLPLLHVACELARAGELPVHVRVVLEGEEEIGGTNALRLIEGDERGADCAIVFDGGMIDERRPAMDIAVRGIVACHVKLRTAERDLHSGVYGGVALSAAAALTQMLAAVLPGPDGRLREELRAGLTAPGAEELESWKALPAGADVLAASGASELAPGAAGELYARTWADSSLDINGMESGDAVQRRTIIPHSASARVTVRVSLGQSAAAIAVALERLLREAAPAGTQVELELDSSEPAGFDPADPALVIAREAIGRAAGQHAAARAHRRLDPDPRGARAARHPDGALGLRARRRRHPRTRRELPPREPRARRAGSARALRGARHAAVAPQG